MIDQYRQTVKPMHDRHCEPSKRHADLIVPEGGANRPALAVLRGFVRDVVRLAATADVAPGPAGRRRAPRPRARSRRTVRGGRPVTALRRVALWVLALSLVPAGWLVVERATGEGRDRRVLVVMDELALAEQAAYSGTTSLELGLRYRALGLSGVALYEDTLETLARKGAIVALLGSELRALAVAAGELPPPDPGRRDGHRRTDARRRRWRAREASTDRASGRRGGAHLVVVAGREPPHAAGGPRPRPGGRVVRRRLRRSPTDRATSPTSRTSGPTSRTKPRC